MICPMCNKQNSAGFTFFVERKGMFRLRTCKVFYNTDLIKCGYCRERSHIDFWGDSWGMASMEQLKKN